MPITAEHTATLAIGQLAASAGIRPSAIRYYERKGLLPPPGRSSGRRRYDPSALQLLRVIRVSQEAGFSLEEIRHLLHGFDRSTPPSERWRRSVEGKLREIDELIARAEGMRALLRRGLECGCLTLEACELLSREQARRRGGRGPDGDDAAEPELGRRTHHPTLSTAR